MLILAVRPIVDYPIIVLQYSAAVNHRNCDVYYLPSSERHMAPAFVFWISKALGLISTIVLFVSCIEVCMKKTPLNMIYAWGEYYQYWPCNIYWSKICLHYDVIKWIHFPRNWSPVNSPHKGQWRGALMFSLICAWINRWVNNGETGDLRSYRAQYEVIAMGTANHVI